MLGGPACDLRSLLERQPAIDPVRGGEADDDGEALADLGAESAERVAERVARRVGLPPMPFALTTVWLANTASLLLNLEAVLTAVLAWIVF
ncbi:hypothetical protein IAE22_33230, partial [Bacillus sp. S34]|nr:hypothetical protein [Bacillus sp. S34]